MEKRDFIVKKPSILIAAGLLAISTGVASAQSRHHQVPAYGTEVTSDRSGTKVPEADTAGERSSSNVQDAVGPAGYFAPHEVPENGGAPSMIQPGSNPNWRQ